MEHGHTGDKIASKHTVKDFIPLIMIAVAIAIFTYIMVLYQKDGSLMFIMRNFMAGFFLVFGGFKVLKWRAFVEAYKMYDVVAMRSTVYAYLYPIIEIGLGVAYLLSWNLVITNTVTLVVMLIGAYGVWEKLKQKEEVPCACLGTVFKLPMTKVTFVEDMIMAIMAGVMIVVLL